jgi:O-antigen ligase
MAAQLRPIELLGALSLATLAVGVGVLAGVEPRLAVAGSLGISFLLMMLADLRIGVGLFVAVTFLETTSVIPGVGLAKLAGGALALSWLALVLTQPSTKAFIWSEHQLFTATLVGFVTWLGLSVVWAPEPGDALSHWLRFALNAAVVPIVYTAIRNKDDLKTVVVAFVIGAGFTAVMALITPPDPEMMDNVARLTSTIGDPNELAATLAAGFMLSVALSRAQPQGTLSRFAFIFVGVICVIASILTVSRGGVLALSAALLFSPLLARRKLQSAVLVASALALIAAFIIFVAPSGTVERLTDRDGGSGRTDIWKVATRVINDRPLTGVGVGNFPNASVSYVITPGAVDNKTLISQPSVAHNMYLEVWAESGFIGLLLFIGVLGSCLGFAVTASKRFATAGDPAMAAVAGGVALALVALFTAYTFLSEQTGNKLWILLALCPPLVSIAGEALRRRTDA